MILRNIGVILTILVGIEHIGIMWLEIFGKPDLQAKSFDMNWVFQEDKMPCCPPVMQKEKGSGRPNPFFSIGVNSLLSVVSQIVFIEFADKVDMFFYFSFCIAYIYLSRFREQIAL